MTVAQTTAVRAIFVAWQQPETRAYYPVARLTYQHGPGEGEYEFVYIAGARKAAEQAFRPFLAFPELDSVYRSSSLFPFFANRLMSPNRPDFPEHLDRLGLSKDADNMTILARSAGVRMTDSLELFPWPVFDPEQMSYQIHFWMHGYHHLQPEEQARVLSLEPGEHLVPRRQPDNPSDPNAIRLYTDDGVFVGFVPRYLAADARQLLSECPLFEVFAERVNPDPAPAQQRLLCRLESCWPDDFLPCDNACYRPIPADAWHIDPGDQNSQG